MAFNNARIDAVPTLCASCEGRKKGICSALDCEQLVELAKASRKSTAESGATLLGETEGSTGGFDALSGPFHHPEAQKLFQSKG